MALARKVLKSLEIPDGGRCVDIFQRPDATFGFEEYRRDPEDGGGWFPIGSHGALAYGTDADALADALQKVPWLKDAARRE